MPTDPVPSSQTAQLTAARDEALRRYTQHLTAVHLKNSRWSAVFSRGRSTLRGHLPAMPAATVRSNPTHAH